MKSWIDTVRRAWPGFLRTRVLMVGCVAGEGVLDGDVTWQMQCIPMLKDALVEEAYKLGASLIVFKEFRASIARCSTACRPTALPVFRACR